MIRSYKIRLFPNKEQQELMWQHIGASRWIWNYMLALQQSRHELGEKYLQRFSMMKLLTPLKREETNMWLQKVSLKTLQITCTDLHKAYTTFFKKINGFPRFKSRKKSTPSFPVCQDYFYFVDECAQIQKLGKVAYKTNYDLPQGKGHKFSNPRISFVNNKWLLSFGMEYENQAPILTDKTMGIDLGIKDLAVVSFDNQPLVFPNINKSRRVRKLERKLKHHQRNVARKRQQGGMQSNRYKAESAVVTKLYSKLANIRNNYTHQITHHLTSMLPCRITMEDLNVSGMMKNKHLSKAIAEQGFAEFIRQIRYKCEWNGIEFQQVPRFYPSSKTCSRCGNVKRDLKLSDREYVCLECGLIIDRDFNAAINLEKYEGTIATTKLSA